MYTAPGISLNCKCIIQEFHSTVNIFYRCFTESQKSAQIYSCLYKTRAGITHQPSVISRATNHKVGDVFPRKCMLHGQEIIHHGGVGHAGFIKPATDGLPTHCFVDLELKLEK